MLGDCHADVKSYYCNAKLLLLYIIIYTHTHTQQNVHRTRQLLWNENYFVLCFKNAAYSSRRLFSYVSSCIFYRHIKLYQPLQLGLPSLSVPLSFTISSSCFPPASIINSKWHSCPWAALHCVCCVVRRVEEVREAPCRTRSCHIYSKMALLVMLDMFAINMMHFYFLSLLLH